MEIIKKKEEFIAWAQEVHWILVGVVQTPDGHPQENFLTPFGELVFMIYDLENKNIVNVGKPMPMPMPIQQPTRLPPGFLKGIPGLNFQGKPHG
jgi:hypothetical protein